jgi:uncharacterized protein (DUF1499 family)
VLHPTRGVQAHRWISVHGRLYHSDMRIHSAHKRIFAVFPVLVLSSLAAMSSPAPKTLTDCPDKPNCVSSLARNTTQAIEPLAYTGSARQAMRRLRTALASERRIRVVTEQERYLHVEARSLIFRFVDDVEFLIAPEDGLIHVRSASRTGYSDLGVNRRRVERIRRAFEQAQ